MPFEHLETAQKVLPSAGVGLNVVLKASWGTAAWVEVISATTAAWLFSGFVLGYQTGVSTNFDIELELGTGAAGSEVVVSTLRARFHGTGAGGSGLPQNLMSPVLLDNIASGVRVAIRGRKDTATDRTWIIKVCYLEKPVTGTVTTTTKPTKPIPFSANSVSVTPSATAWVNSGWTELTAATTAAIVVTALIVGAGVAAVDAEIDIGTGAAGDESVKETIKIGLESDTEGIPSVARLWPPFDGIASGARVAVRMRKAGTSVVAWRFALDSIEKPI